MGLIYLYIYFIYLFFGQFYISDVVMLICCWCLCNAAEWMDT